MHCITRGDWCCGGLGSEVTELKKGDRVMAGLSHDRCGHCKACYRGETTSIIVRTQFYAGIAKRRAFTESMVARRVGK